MNGVPFVQAATAGAHALIAPSSLHITELCPGSVQMQAQFPELPSPAGLEGDACHWVMLEVLKFGRWPAIGSAAPNGVLIDQTMHDAIAVMRDALLEVTPDLRGMVVESPVRVRAIHESECWGTPDVRVWFERGGRIGLLVADLKYGFAPVEVFENPQLTAYAAGVWDLEHTRIEPDTVDVIFMIVQPRAYHRSGIVRTWRTTMNALQPRLQRLSFAADDALSPVAECRPQPSACEYCSARAHCEALQTAAYRFTDVAMRATPSPLSDRALSLELAYLTDGAELMKARITGLEEVAKHRLQQGHMLPQWKFAPGRSATKWKYPVAQIIEAGKMFGKDLTQPVDVITPLQAQARGLPSDVVAIYSESIPGATKLTRDNGQEAKRIFTEV